MKKNKSIPQLLLFFVMCCIAGQPLQAQNKQSELFTPFTKISTTPGSSISFNIDVINNEDNTTNESITVSGLPRSWKYSIKSKSYNIEKLAVLPGQKQSITLQVEVPYKVKKGNYTLYVKKGSKATLPLTIRVKTGGSGDSKLSCEQKNMEGASDSKFEFSAKLKNNSPINQQYALMAKAPKGWKVTIKASGKQATSTEVTANGTKNIKYEIKAPTTVKAGTYKIPVEAVAGSSSSKIELEIVITGTYEMDFTTPSGLLSDHITAGEKKEVSLVVKNTGTIPLENIKITSSNPKKWNVKFSPEKVEKIMPGERKTVTATITADKKALPGDYAVRFSAKTSDVKEKISYRILVKTPILMGWLGILIIIVAIGSVLLLFKKYGRR